MTGQSRKRRCTDLTRRHFLSSLAAGAAIAATGWPRSVAAADTLAPPPGKSPSELARDEWFWREVANFYDRTEGILNLEHGYWGKMARPVQAAYLDALQMVNAQNSFYARKDFDTDEAEAIRRIARSLGAHADEIAVTRNATEACYNLIRQYRGLEPGDKVLFADIDYPDFKTHMRWLGEGRDSQVVEIEIPTRANQDQIRDLYLQAFEANPGLKLMLITHVSNQHGLVVPVAEIAAEARRRGIDVICDAAQSWGLLDFDINELGVDWAAFNLHKWIGAPVGTGALYIRRGALANIAPYPGETEAGEPSIASRVHSGTINFASRLAIAPALDFHEALGPANKEARLRYLRSLWTDAAEDMNHIEVLGGTDEPSWTGIGSFRLLGKSTLDDAQELQQRLEDEFGIFTVVRKGLASGACVRITPQVFTSADEIGQLVDAMYQLAV